MPARTARPEGMDVRVLAAMSGGVDSAVVAARLLAAGHEVTGVHLALQRSATPYLEGSRGCCSLADSNDARRVADKLGIPFYVWDFSQRFAIDVLDDFLAEYSAGRTPNPCLRCNATIKFQALMERGLALGFDAVATGHYALLREGPDGVVTLHRGIDQSKDQSYVLGVLDQHQLSHCLFPLGDSLKTQVRVEAAELGLRVADKPDSVDICFIPDGDTAGFLTKALGPRPGKIVDTTGQQVGEHTGFHQFTVGQRRGLKLGVPAADGQPRHVLGIDPVHNRVTVGAGAELLVTGIEGIRPTWTQHPMSGQWQGLAQLRAHGAPLPACFRSVTGADGSPQVEATLDEPVPGVAPGQAMVIYDGDRVVGSATIAATRRPVTTGTQK